MSLYEKATLAQIPSGYKAADAKLYSVVPNTTAGDFTVSSDADATRVNKDGLVETTVANQARLNYDPTNPQDPHLLLEPTRQNIIQYSELFNNSYWTKENVTIGTGIVSPMGDTDAQNIIEDTTTGRHRVRASLAVSSGTTYSLSVWAKSTNRNLVINADLLFNARSGFNLSTGSVENTTSGTATITAFPNDWFLCTVTGTATSTQTAVSYLQMQTGTTDVNYTGDGSSTLSLFGAQLEAGSYATSYIPTTTAQVTRTADTCKLENFTNAPTNYPFTVFCDMEIAKTGQKSYAFSFLDISVGNRFFVVGYNVDGGGNFFRFDNQNNGINYNQKTSSTYEAGRHKIAVKFISSTQFKGFIDGVEVVDKTHTSSPFNSNINDFLLGQLRVSGDTGDRNPIHQFMVFNEELTDAELTTLTT